MSLIYWKDKIFVSKGTGIGFLIFGLTLAFIILNDNFKIVSLSERYLAMFSGLSLIIFLLGFIIDQLISRNFNFWAFGAVISFIGVAIFFSPIILYGLGNNSLSSWILLVLIGIILIIFGYGIEATEINKKFAKLLLSIYDSIRSYNWKSIPSRLAHIGYFLITNLFIYILTGLKNLRGLLIKTVKQLFLFLKQSVDKIIHLLVGIPTIIYNTIKSFIQLSIWLIIPSSIIIGLSFVAPYNSGFFSILIIASVYFSTIFIYKRRDQFTDIAFRVSEYSYEKFITANQMVASIKHKMGVYKCQNCHSKISLSDSKCKTCQTSLTTCMICKLPIQANSSKHTCEKCLNDFHQNHYSQWIKLNKVCPVCRVAV